MQPGFHGSQRRVHDQGNFVQFQISEIAQRQHALLIRRQIAEYRLYGCIDLQTGHPLGDVFRARQRLQLYPF